MDIKTQIQLINTQIINIKLGIDSLDMQTNNMLMMNYNQIGEQLLNLSIQILNTGIQTFNIGKNISMNYNIYSEKLKLISEQINLLINENNMIQQQQMMQQQMMMMPNYPPILMQHMKIPQNKPEIYNIIFSIISIEGGNIKNILAQKGMTIKELINKYINTIKDEFSEDEINKMKFYSTISGIGFLNRNDETKKVDYKYRNITVYVEF